MSDEDGTKNFHGGPRLFLTESVANMRDAIVERNPIVDAHHAVATVRDVTGMVYRRRVRLGHAVARKYVNGGFLGSRFASSLESPADPRRFATKPWFCPLPGSPRLVDGKTLYGAQL